MSGEEKKNIPENSGLQIASEAANIGLRVAAPYKEIIKWIIIGFTIALILTNAIWAGVHFYAIKKAYQEPTTYEQEQSQDIPSQKQEQINKGSVN